MTVELVSFVVFAVVSGSREHHDAGIDQPAHGATDRIVTIRIDRRHTETHVHDADVVGDAICSNPIERAQHVAGGARPCEFKTRRLIRFAFGAIPRY